MAPVMMRWAVILDPSPSGSHGEDATEMKRRPLEGVW